ncbi:MAG: prepilin-type N-terminal cleavage/methylation domain-containing protein [Fimbriimonadaceae bacterium]|nr:prepilin-type N-terminal cleavage/methylation domain-containing protein [Fimbriimonadaceae bacterium]
MTTPSPHQSEFRGRRGFTLIELLTVIAIIALLAAIIFPVFSRARAEAYRNGDITAMNGLRSALQLYREDQGGYPPALLGYVNRYAGGPNDGQVIPADQVKSYLFPRRVSSINDFRPSNNRAGVLEIVPATWPTADGRAVGVAPVSDTNGDGAVTVADDIADARQAFGPGDGCLSVVPGQVVACNDANAQAFYRISGYDVARARGAVNHEIRYSLFYTVLGLGTGGANDDPRQLGYNSPPDNTILTWNGWWREYDSTGAPVAGRRDIVLTVGGAARPADSRSLAQQSWRYLP